jgi:hypothetical protein
VICSGENNEQMQKMQGFMNEYYEKIKDSIGISEKFKKKLDQDYGLDAVFKRLEPNTKVQNFKQFLKENNYRVKKEKKGIFASMKNSRKVSAGSSLMANQTTKDAFRKVQGQGNQSMVITSEY